MIVSPVHSLTKCLRAQLERDPLEILAPGDVSVAFASLSLKNLRWFPAEKFSNALCDYWCFRPEREEDEYFRDLARKSSDLLWQFRKKVSADEDVLEAQFAVRAAAGFHQWAGHTYFANCMMHHLTCGQLQFRDPAMPNRVDLLNKARLKQEIDAAELMVYAEHPHIVPLVFETLSETVSIWYRARW